MGRHQSSVWIANAIANPSARALAKTGSRSGRPPGAQRMPDQPNPSPPAERGPGRASTLTGKPGPEDPGSRSRRRRRDRRPLVLSVGWFLVLSRSLRELVQREALGAEQIKGHRRTGWFKDEDVALAAFTVVAVRQRQHTGRDRAEATEYRSATDDLITATEEDVARGDERG